MSESDTPKAFHTLRGAIRGEEPDEPLYFAHRATLRIFGDNLPFEEISKRLGVQPTHVHHKGDLHGRRSPPWRDDAWCFEPALSESEPLAQHIDALWQVLKPHAEYLRSLKQQYRVDAFCGYRSNSDHAGIEVPHTCLEMFTTLEVPFGVSMIIT
jgi:hypothetical protein